MSILNFKIFIPNFKIFISNFKITTQKIYIFKKLFPKTKYFSVAEFTKWDGPHVYVTRDSTLLLWMFYTMVILVQKK